MVPFSNRKEQSELQVLEIDEAISPRGTGKRQNQSDLLKPLGACEMQKYNKML